ncbi:bile acid:sodium symporter family protein [Frateuria defendens]|uniref:bile acid:sodium symporter family protein n=1 Tax=Frateuria defendens TaxID=2219559 RepID=UPI00066FE4FC|nr:bile acid:sodium symporter family protein [Frateuria defendens]
MHRLAAFSRFVGNTFMLWVLLAALAGYLAPAAFTPLTPWIGPLLGVVMFGMGLTLTAADFVELRRRPWDVALGTLGHFVIMPGLAWLLVKLFTLPTELAVGVLIVGCCPSGTASNVMTYLAHGDVALSVAIASVSTLLAPVFTPFLLWLLGHSWVQVGAGGLVLSILGIVIVPVVLGALCRRLLRARVEACLDALPLVSVATIVVLVAAVVAASHARLASAGFTILGVVMLHNLLGLALGYGFGRLCGMPVAKRKSLALEVGMQNSGLGAALAVAHFSPLAAVPSAIFSVWHNVSGPLAATLFRRLGRSEPPASP